MDHCPQCGVLTDEEDGRCVSCQQAEKVAKQEEEEGEELLSGEGDLPYEAPKQYWDKICPSCDSPHRTPREHRGIYQCSSCGCVYGRASSYEVTLAYVKDEWDVRMPVTDPIAALHAASQEQGYDFIYMRGGKIERRHGFFNPKTRCITQVG